MLIKREVLRRVDSYKYSFNVRLQLLQLLYTSVIYSIMTFSVVCCSGNSAKQDRRKLSKKTRITGWGWEFEGKRKI